MSHVRRPRFSDNPGDADPSTAPSPGQLTAAKIKEMMANAQREIEERKRQLQQQAQLKARLGLSSGMITPNVPAVPLVVPPPQLIQTPMSISVPVIPKSESSLPSDNKARLAELQAKIQARLATAKLPIQTQTIPPIIPDQKLDKPAPLILNAEGRTVDLSGKEVKLVHHQPTLKANIRAQKREQFTRISQEKSTEDEANFFDPRVEIKAPVRPKKAFSFYEKGTFEQMGHKLRTKAKLEQLQKEIGQIAKKTGISSAARLALLNSIESKKEEYVDDTPDIEWWDAFVLKDKSYEEALKNKQTKSAEELFEGITHLIEHPMQLRPPAEPTKPLPLPVFLTKKEQKKLRRQNRREAWKEKQEKIRLGLEPPPEPKVKMSNMMRVLGTQAVQDPTKIEAAVREQVAKRQREHEEANATRKLTDEQRKEKKIKKLKEDTTLGVHVSVYRVLNLTNPARKFKVETNAKQLMLTGIAVLFKNVNVVVVEGGPKQQKKFRQLMMNRIKWSEESAHNIHDNTTEGEDIANACFLVWEGMNKSRSFGDFRIKVSPNESFAKELFKNHHVPHYWDLAYSLSILDAQGT